MADSHPGPRPGAPPPLPYPGLVALPTLQAATVLEPVRVVSTDGDGECDADAGACRRRHPRLVAPPCRPITVRCLDGGEADPQPWLYADILDISLGGLCLLITAELALELGQPFIVDFRAHRLPDAHERPDCCLQATLRWFVHSGYVSTLGLGFDHQLLALPDLLPERRQRLRDPNPPSAWNPAKP